MVVNNTTKEIKQISEMDKDMLLKALSSAKKTRKKVRENIKNNTLPEVPKEIDEFLKDEVA